MTDVKPIVFDLFAGLVLGQIQFLRRANVFIKQLVASWAEYPNHMRLRVFYLSPRTISLVLWPVCNFQYPILAARLTLLRQMWIFALQSDQQSVGNGRLELYTF
jgi:hypothetical protein